MPKRERHTGPVASGTIRAGDSVATGWEKDPLPNGRGETARRRCERPARAIQGDETMQMKSLLLSRRLFLASTGAASVGLAAGRSYADALDDIRAAGVLTVGTGVMGSKPWIWKNEDGSLAGMDYDMVQYLIKKLGVPK